MTKPPTPPPHWPPAPPVAPVTYYSPAPGPTRPTSVTVCSIIGIVVGAIGILCLPLGVLPFLVDVPVPEFAAMRENRAMMAYLIGSIGLSWLLSVAMLVCSIGCLILREWARVGMVWVGAGNVVIGLAELALSLAWIDPAMRAAGGGGVIESIVGYAVSVAIIAFSVVVWFVFTRPPVKAAFSDEHAVGPHVVGS